MNLISFILRLIIYVIYTLNYFIKANLANSSLEYSTFNDTCIENVEIGIRAYGIGHYYSKYTALPVISLCKFKIEFVKDKKK